MFRASPKARLGELLVRRQLINATQLEQALLLQQQTGLKLGQILVQKGWISCKQLDQTLSRQRFQHMVASVLVTCGTLFSTVPKAAIAQPVAPIMTLDPNAQPPDQASQSGSTSARLATTWQRSNQQRPQDVDAIPLAANPTESSPLIGFCHPLQGFGLLTQGFRGITHQGRMAYARDYQVSLGTPVYAMRSGRVIGVEDRFADTGGGPDKVYEFNYILIEHQGGFRSAYLHLHQGFLGKAGIKVGDFVRAGQLVGYSGNSGWSTGPHLHVEIQAPSEPGSFGQTVPFKLGRSCGTGIVAAESPVSPSSSTEAQGAGDTLNHVLQPSEDERSSLRSQALPAPINIPLACAGGGCVCLACAMGGGHVNLSSHITPTANSALSDRLERLLTP